MSIRQYNIYLVAVFIFIITGCEKVIDVDLSASAPAFVIEGNLNKKTGMADVFISKTVNYFGSSTSNPVTGAIISVENSSGVKFKLSEIKTGQYKSQIISTKDGEVYKLNVEVGGKKVEAISRLNPAVPIDSVTYIYEKGFAFIEEGYYITLHFKDPPGIENYYRVKVFKNGNYKNDDSNLIIFDDRLLDGNNIKIGLPRRVFEIGQKATVELISLDAGAFEFYKTFRELLNVNPGSSAPSNPTTNFSNGALGYFSAWSSNQLTITIK